MVVHSSVLARLMDVIHYLSEREQLIMVILTQGNYAESNVINDNCLMVDMVKILDGGTCLDYCKVPPKH